MMNLAIAMSASARRTVSSSLARLLAGGLLAAGFAGSASAHAVLTPPEASVGAVWRGAVRISHGCEGTPTRLVRVTIPDGVVAVRPKAKHGWLIETTWAPYLKPVDIHGKKVTEGVRTITWKGAALPDHMFDDFEFMVRIQPDVALQGGKLYFPVYQECEKGSFDWAQIPAVGQNPHDLKAPAPALILQAAGQGSGSGVIAGAGAAPAHIANTRQVVVSGGWARATPKGAKVAGAYVTIANGGSKDDVLLGGRFDVADRVEVHDMAMKDGVMRMRHLAQGLEIPAGGSVELRPGGLHLMLMGLTKPLQQGEAIKGVLTFRDAGDVAVTLPVEPAGSPGPGKAPADAGSADGHGEHHQHGDHAH